MENVYDLQTLIHQFQRKQKIKFLFFWGHRESPNGEITSSCFSQWWASPFVVDGVKYPTAEHWMMAQKALLFNDLESYQKIINAKSPAEAKTLGRAVKNFNEEVWNTHRFDIVVNGNLAKFTQNEALKNYLINTGKRILVEASPVDRIWGIGLTADSEKAKNPMLWNGLNLLGFALMKVRDLIIGN